MLCNYFNSSPPQIKNELINNFEDEGLRHNAQVLMFNEFPSYLRPSLRDEIFESEVINLSKAMLQEFHWKIVKKVLRN